MRCDPQNVLYIELWAGSKSEIGQYYCGAIRAWTILELFDLEQNLISGKFRVPFYSL